MRIVLVLVPLVLMGMLLTGVLGGDPAEDAGVSPGSPDDPTAPGTLRIEIGGDPIEAEEETPRRSVDRPPPPDPDPEPDPPPVRTRTHIVERGDTLRGLAREYYGDPERWIDIKRANDLPDDVIQLGQKLVIPD